LMPVSGSRSGVAHAIRKTSRAKIRFAICAIQ
jgi:hypothetical protein